MEKTKKTAGFLAVKPQQSFHMVECKDGATVGRIRDMRESNMWINGGCFVPRQEIFDYMEAGDELVLEPFARLIAEDKLMACRYEGFWMAMDTFKDKRALDDMYERDEAPWEVWKRDRKSRPLTKARILCCP